MTIKKGQKRLKNIPILHDEVKERHQIVVTPTAWESMRQEAQKRGISISELIEEFGRRINSH
jgi:deoxyhypusine synthase